MSEEKDVKVATGEATPAPPPKLLTAEEIIAADDIKTEVVEVPEWGGAVTLRMMSGAEAVEFVKAVQADKTGASTSQAIKIVGLSAVDGEGKPLFSEHQLRLLQKKSLKALMRLQNKALEINGLSAEEGEKTKKA